jgi:hypothetical protein
MASQYSIGERHWSKGFCTNALVLRGKSLRDLETLLGFRSGRLDAGASVSFLQRMPTPDEFRLAGYTYFSHGAVAGHRLKPAERDSARMEELLKKEKGWSAKDVQKFKAGMIGRSIVIFGPERIAKLTPVTPHTESEEYPPGRGVFQIELVSPLPFVVKGIIGHGGKWLGDYSD